MKTLFPYKRQKFNNELILENLPDEILDILLRNQDQLKYKKGQLLYHEGATPNGLFYIQKGRVKKFATGYDGKEHIYYICGERELLGYHPMLCDETNPDSAETLEPCELIFIPKGNFMMALKTSPDFHSKLLQNLSHECGAFINATMILAQYSVRERTALALLIINEKYLSGGSLDATIDLSRDDLSNYVGTAKESLVRILRDFKDEGFISSSGRGIVIKDFDALIRISNFFG